MEDRTSIVIAHRLSTILNAHLIVVMSEGRIVDMGKHAKLLERCAIYRKLYELQFGVIDNGKNWPIQGAAR